MYTLYVPIEMLAATKSWLLFTFNTGFPFVIKRYVEINTY